MKDSQSSESLVGYLPEPSIGLAKKVMCLKNIVTFSKITSYISSKTKQIAIQSSSYKPKEDLLSLSIGALQSR